MEVERELSLRKDQVAKVGWECRINAGKNGDAIILECVYSAFCPIALMHIWGSKLEFGAPSKCDGLFEGSAGFIVHDL